MSSSLNKNSIGFCQLVRFNILPAEQVVHNCGHTYDLVVEIDPRCLAAVDNQRIWNVGLNALKLPSRPVRVKGAYAAGQRCAS